MNYSDLKDYINSNNIDTKLNNITCSDTVFNEKDRYLNLLEKAYKLYGDGDYHIISSPGRSEIGGNHTDHQHGHVLACALNIDNVCVVKVNNTNICNFSDEKFNPISVDITDLQIQEIEKNTSMSLIRGISAKLKELGYKTGGFDAVCDSRVLIGSGISSSACFEMMVVEIFNALFNEDRISDIDRAKIGQYAENVYFGKPSGLMDQMAISVGGFIAIDFKDVNNPIIEKYNFSFDDYGYSLMLINTKGDHADLSNEYAAITSEIKDVAKLLNVEYLADTDYETFINKLPEIRYVLKNDRAILRAGHFFKEDKRAIEEKIAVKNSDVNTLLKLIKESGRSSFEYLQNVYPSSRTSSQSLAVGLYIADSILGDSGAYRIHGGGFDGTIQAIVPVDKVDDFCRQISYIFGCDSILCSKVRNSGTALII